LRKQRPHKPLALMCESAAAARRFCRVSAQARAVLASPAAPVVLLPKASPPRLRLSELVAPANGCLGVMVAYTPLHVVLFERLRRLRGRLAVLVMTSANRRDDPITANDEDLDAALAGVPDLVLTHDRPIANRCDDSVVQAGESSRAPVIMVRRARGYAPQPIPLGRMFHVKHPVLAVGGEFKNVFALAAGGRAFLSPHIGTVATTAGEEFWREALARYRDWTRIRPELIATDLHPDYAATRLAERLSRELSLPLLRVQHHHAHVLSVMAEYDLAGPVLGIAFDGTGYGSDGAVWGGEFLLVEGDANWQRVGHLGYLRLSSAGDEVADPKRVAKAYIAQAGVTGGSRGGPSGRTLLTSSVGRLFDAVAALTGVCRTATFDGQAPIALEAAADRQERGRWLTPDLLDFSVSPALIRPEPILRSVARETSAGVASATVAARFHNTLAAATVRLADELCRRVRTNIVCIAGGSFQNTLLRSRVVAGLAARGRRVFRNQAVPLNDGGVALGQVAAGAFRTR
jgi:hydrogenase maturation protein HypF